MAYEKQHFGFCTDQICKSNKVHYDLYNREQPCYVSDHHLFPQTKLNRELYPEYIDLDTNLQKSICQAAHERAKNIQEIEFCKLNDITPRSLTGRLIWDRMLKNGQV